MDIYSIMKIGILNNSSDIHITENEYIRFRINGNLEVTDIFIETKDMEKIKEDILYIEEIENLDKNIEIDKAINYENHRFRIHIYKDINGIAMGIRIISLEIPDIKKLNLPKQIYNIENINSGLIIISGSTGSGKTTTMASIVESINRRKNKHIITIENPIEYIYKSKKSLINQREIGKEVINFDSAIKSVVRQDPDIIILGEIRDKASIKAAITLGELGHLVLTTIHSRSVLDTISRIIDIFPEGDKNQIKTQLANSLKIIVNQELIIIGDKRYPLCEIMTINKAIKNIIRENGNFSSIIDQMSINKKENLLKNDSIKFLENVVNTRIIAGNDIPKMEDY